MYINPLQCNGLISAAASEFGLGGIAAFTHLKWSVLEILFLNVYLQVFSFIFGSRTRELLPRALSLTLRASDLGATLQAGLPWMCLELLTQPLCAGGVSSFQAFP